MRAFGDRFCFGGCVDSTKFLIHSLKACALLASWLDLLYPCNNLISGYIFWVDEKFSPSSKTFLLFCEDHFTEIDNKTVSLDGVVGICSLVVFLRCLSVISC